MIKVIRKSIPDRAVGYFDINPEEIRGRFVVIPYTLGRGRVKELKLFVGYLPTKEKVLYCRADARTLKLAGMIDPKAVKASV